MKEKSLSGLILILLLMLTACATGSLPTPSQLATEHFAECPSDYQQQVENQIGNQLVDPYSAVYRFSRPRKFVYEGKFGSEFFVGINAKNRFGGYTGEETHEYMCFPDGSIREINQFVNGMRQGVRESN